MNIRCNGIPSFCAQWMWAKLGGFAIMACAMKGFAFDVVAPSFTSSASAHDFQQPWRISAMPLRLLPTSPSFSDFIPWDEARILHHERHQLGRIAANFKELQAIFLNELFERPVRG